MATHDQPAACVLVNGGSALEQALEALEEVRRDLVERERGRREAMENIRDRWVAAAQERHEAVLGRATSRSWRFTNVVFASDLEEVVYGRDRFGGMDPDLRAGCLEGLLRAALETPNCGIAIPRRHRARRGRAQ